MKKILVIKLRKIGDVLLCVPAVRALKEHWPDCSVSALVNKGTEEMLSGNPWLDEVLIFDRAVKKKYFLSSLAAQWDLIRQIRQKHFDIIVDLTSGDRPAIIAALSGAKYRIGHDPRGKGFFGKKFLYTQLVPFNGKEKHIVESNLDVVRLLGIDPKDKSVSINISSADQTQADKWLAGAGFPPDKKIIHFHPTSDWLFKCWTDEAAAQLLDYLQLERGYKVVVTSSPAAKEIDKLNNILRLAQSKPLNLAGRTSLKQLAAVSSRSRLFIGMDSAPMHIAAAVGTPVVALFGPSGEHMWRPWGDGHTVITKGMPCRPCGKDGCNGSKRSKCLEDISVDEVKAVVDRYLSG
ncbi:MAG: putative lipopolysaccharide heptosyltransferase III [Candidatus Schekmanbacteria bacterium]|nr:putative lipopolysaccharide heptosyltransferase III [Candidatus Schekmanbacteria bacterium]